MLTASPQFDDRSGDVARVIIRCLHRTAHVPRSAKANSLGGHIRPNRISISQLFCVSKFQHSRIHAKSLPRVALRADSSGTGP